MRLLAVILGTLVLAGCGAPQPPTEVVRPVQLAQVAIGAAGAAAVFAGEVKPRYEADLGFRIGGKVIARSVDVGARVKKGQVLARLDPADVGLQAVASKAQVAATETELRFAQAEYERYQNLFNEKFISASGLDAKRNTLDANRAKHEQAKANLAVSQNQASYASLVASEDGVVTAVNAEPGQVVTAGQSVVRVAREEEREVAISIPENRVGELGTPRSEPCSLPPTGAGALGRPCGATKNAPTLVVALWALPGKQYRGRVREVSPAVDPATRTFSVRVTIEDADAAVQWGMTANVGVIGAGESDVALLPLTSIYHDEGKPAVWRYDPASGKVAIAPVEIGQYREDGVVVTAGVRSGDWIVTAGVHKLIPGQVVRPYESGSTAARPDVGRTLVRRDAASG